MSVTVSAEGTVAAAQTDDLSFSSAGTVTAVNVKAGDTVKAGQVLATIDSAALQSAVTSAEADLASAQAKLSDDESVGRLVRADRGRRVERHLGERLADRPRTSALAKASLVATFDGTVAAVNITNGEQLSSSGTGATAATGTGSGSGQSSANLGSSNSRVPAASSSSDSSSSSTAQIQVVSTGRYTVQLAVDTADIASVAVGQTATITRSTSSAATGRFGAGGFAALFGRGAATGTGNGRRRVEPGAEAPEPAPRRPARPRRDSSPRSARSPMRARVSRPIRSRSPSTPRAATSTSDRP